jgi:uncharacterized membrane protein (UPF0127 family)
VRRIRGIPGVFTALLLLAACREEEPPPFVALFPYDTAYVTVRGDGASARLLVEIAETQEKKELGLGLRPSLDRGSGLLFPYDSAQPETAGYYMWRMRIPIDLAYLDSAGTVVRLFSLEEPCDAIYRQACPVTVPGVPYWSVLETNLGWFAENGLGEGAVVTVEPR